MKYNNQGYYDPTIQLFMLENSSEFKSENSEGSGYGGIHVTNQGSLNNEKNWVFEEAYVDKVFVVSGDPDLYFLIFWRMKK